MHHVAVVLRNPRCNHWIQLKIPHFLYETYRSSLSKQKITHSGDGGKKLSKDLAVTPENISWCLNPDFYGIQDFLNKKQHLLNQIKKKWLWWRTHHQLAPYHRWDYNRTGLNYSIIITTSKLLINIIKLPWLSLPILYIQKWFNEINLRIFNGGSHLSKLLCLLNLDQKIILKQR